MKSIFQFRTLFARLLVLTLCPLAILFSNFTFAQGAQVPLNTPQVLSADIAVGATSVSIPFTLSGVDGLSMEVIAPTNGVQMQIVGPNGFSAQSGIDPRIRFNAGSGLTPPLPGGVFIVTPEIATPANGQWIIVLTFPAAQTPTSVLVTINARSKYQVGIVTDRTTYLVGEDISIGFIALENGRPIIGLSPTIAVGIGAPAPASDSGTGPDGLANDGIYSIDFTPTTAGTFIVKGTVNISTPSGVVRRDAISELKVVPPKFSAVSVSASTLTGIGGCVSGVRVDAAATVAKAGNYITRVALSAGGKVIEQRRSTSLSIGNTAISVQFTATDIKQKLGVDGPYSVSLVEVIEINGTEFELSFRRTNAAQINARLLDLCSQPIEIRETVTVTPVLKQGLIDTLDITFPVRVRSGGSYQISFKVLGPAGEDLGLINASRSLPTGESLVTTNVSAREFRALDGAYKVVSLLVVGGGSSARVATLGQTPTYSRWQFYPRITGDLNNDGAVDAADESLLATFRNARALVPGDRRDINKDGVVDVRDVRELQKLRCAVNACPINP